MTTPFAPPAVAAASVLMSTYARETAANLAASLESLRRQSRPAAELVLVIDGPVGADQEAVIAAFAADPGPTRLVLLRRPVSGGLARAMNDGLALCSHEVILRMDSDDLCLPDRIALETEYLAAHPEIGIVASWAEEFDDSGAPDRLKVAPVDHASIVAALRWRNVIVHQSVAVRATALKAVGGYSPRFGLLEDYDLWTRLALAGTRFHIIPKVLVRARTGSGMTARRGGWRYALNDLRFRIAGFRAGFLSAGQLLAVTTLYTGFRLMSGPMRGRLYGLVRR